jgi:hypothetical protein
MIFKALERSTVQKMSAQLSTSMISDRRIVLSVRQFVFLL